ncbi:MAG: hypothetical protein ACRDRR_02010 [Pseudonocardiaceae bacterium]
MDEFNDLASYTGGWYRRGTTIILDDSFAAELPQAETDPGGGAAPPRRPGTPSHDQVELLKSFFGSNEVGAQARMGNFWVPPRLKQSTLLSGLPQMVGT